MGVPMSIENELVVQHYSSGEILEQILKGIKVAGKDVNDLAIDDLAPVDEFHTRGRQATTELASLSPISAGQKVLDVGSGLGGTARHLAQTTGCHVEGIDLTQEYVDVAGELTKMVGMQDQVQFQRGSALELPFQNGTFDVVWTEHVQMNIDDKDRFYCEISRVLKPDGQMFFHDVFLSSVEGELQFPLPWATNEEMSAVKKVAIAKTAIRDSGMTIAQWIDQTEASLKGFSLALNKISQNGLPPLGIHLLMGDSAKSKLQNYVDGMSKGLFEVAMGVARRS